MYARVLRFDVGFGRPELAERIATETQTAMSRWPGFQSMQLLADYLGGRYTLVSYWDDDRHLYDFSYSADSKQLEDLIDGLMVKVPYVGTYAVYQPGSGAGQ